MRRALREMLQGPALKIEERAFPRGMHYLQNIGAAVPHRKMKVVVVFAGEPVRGNFQAVKFPRKPHSFVDLDRCGDASLRHHQPNLICAPRRSSMRDSFAAEESKAEDVPRDLARATPLVPKDR